MNILILNCFTLLVVIIDKTYGCSSSCSSCTIPVSDCCQRLCQPSCTESECATKAPVIPTNNLIRDTVKPSVANTNPINVTSIVDVKNEIHNINEIHIPVNITNVNSNSIHSLGGRTQPQQHCNNGTVISTSNCYSENSTRIPIPVPVPVPQDRPVPIPQPFPVPVPVKHPYPVPIPYTKYIVLPQPYTPCESPCNNIHSMFPHPYPFPFLSKSWETPSGPLSPYPPFNMFGGGKSSVFR